MNAPHNPSLEDVRSKANAALSPLTDTTKPHGRIRFIHKDGKEHCFWSAVNSMTGSRLSAFDSDAPSIDDPMTWVKSVFLDIRRKAVVIEETGTL